MQQPHPTSHWVKAVAQQFYLGKVVGKANHLLWCQTDEAIIRSTESVFVMPLIPMRNVKSLVMGLDCHK
jgi:hypothetical protein